MTSTTTARVSDHRVVTLPLSLTAFVVDGHTVSVEELVSGISIAVAGEPKEKAQRTPSAVPSFPSHR